VLSAAAWCKIGLGNTNFSNIICIRDLVAILVKRLKIRFFRPAIIIEDEITCREIRLDGIPFIANGVRVRNRGRSAAQGCRAYVESTGNDMERTGWMLPDNDNEHTLALNEDTPAYVDLCAISNDAKTRVITHERGYMEGRVESCSTLPPGDCEITLKVTSSNGRPTARRIRIHDTYTHFPGEIGRIVEFIG
jgi:hypothetical protein